MLFRDISFDMIVFILAENTSCTFSADQNFAVFFVLPVLSISHYCESLSQNLELAIRNHYRILK